MSRWEALISRIRAGKLSDAEIATVFANSPQFEAYFNQRARGDGSFAPGTIHGLCGERPRGDSDGTDGA